MAFMAVTAFVAYMSFTQPVTTERPQEQTALYSLVPAATIGPPPTATPVEPGEPLLYMQIPRFGDDWLWTVSEGTSLDVLAKGPGHFIGTPLPGEEGNSAYAAHRATHGDPFIDFDRLEAGDTVTVAQSGASWTYEIVAPPKIIEPDESWVVGAVKADGEWLTLTTCWPKYGSEKRMYVRAKMVATHENL